MKRIFFCFFFVSIVANTFAQVQRSVGGQSAIRDNIVLNEEFRFFRDWTKIAKFKSGIGETIEMFPIIYSVPSKKTEMYGLQLDAEVKPQNEALKISYSSAGANLLNKDFIKRSIFIDKQDVSRFVSFLEREVVPHLKDAYKKQSMEYVFKAKEMFFSFLIYEKTARITFHIIDFGPLGDGIGGGDQIEFWTEAKIDEIPELLETVKGFLGKMK